VKHSPQTAGNREKKGTKKRKKKQLKHTQIETSIKDVGNPKAHTNRICPFKTSEPTSPAAWRSSHCGFALPCELEGWRRRRARGRSLAVVVVALPSSSSALLVSSSLGLGCLAQPPPAPPRLRPAVDRVYVIWWWQLWSVVGCFEWSWLEQQEQQEQQSVCPVGDDDFVTS
jgi:hypothetical protein